MTVSSEDWTCEKEQFWRLLALAIVCYSVTVIESYYFLKMGVNCSSLELSGMIKEKCYSKVISFLVGP